MKTRANKAVAKVAFGALALNAAFPALAFAAEAEQEGGISAILPDMAEFIPMLIAFIILWIILAKFGWPMFAGMLEKRENTIREALKKSEEAQIESERVLAEYNKQLADAKAQSAQIIADARSVGEAVKADITAQAQTEAADMIRDEILQKMAELRIFCDEAENLTAEKYWPFPTYGKLLFGVR